MFFEFGIKDFIDILLVAFVLYYTYKLMKASGSIKVFTGILVFILIWLVVTQVLEMKLLGSIFDTLMNVGVIALIVLFQDEIRRFLLTLGSHRHVSALVISKGRIKAAGCILPVSHDLNIPKELGLRHRAAMGISQQSDAHAIIVSEETGGISVAYRGQFYLRLNAEELESLLTKEN